MVDTTAALESPYITAELVKKSTSKKLVVLGEGNYEEVTFDGETSNRLTLPVEIDGKKKVWRPNKDSITNMNEKFGTNTASWVGKVAKLQTTRIQGKDMVIAIPE